MTTFSASRSLAGVVPTLRFSSQARVRGASRPAISYTLPAGQAMTVLARGSGVLRIGGGRLWVTFSPAGSSQCVPAGDYFLAGGESLRLSAGQTVVMESWPEADAAPACISWEADAPRRWLTGLRHALGWAA